MKKLLMLGFSLFLLVGCTSKAPAPQEPEDNTDKSTEFVKDDAKTMIATITTNQGVIVAELYQDLAPETVNNFATLANDGYYDGILFHRVISGFMIQGGDPKGNGTGGPGYTIKGEFATNGHKNLLKHTRGVLSMARTPRPNSGGSQFFIMHQDSPSLDGDYAAFGKVIEGIEVVDKIANVKTGAQDLPKTDMVIENITVDTKGLDISEFKKLK